MPSLVYRPIRQGQCRIFIEPGLARPWKYPIDTPIEFGDNGQACGDANRSTDACVIEAVWTVQDEMAFKARKTDWQSVPPGLVDQRNPDFSKQKTV
jgi:hypothetical protein